MLKKYVDIRNIDWVMKEKEYEGCELETVDYGSFESIMKVNRIYKTIDETGNCTPDEREFVIGYMKSGFMGGEDIDDYEDLRAKSPQANLPEVDF